MMNKINSKLPSYSAIIPVCHRVDDLVPLVAEYNSAFASTGESYEIIVVLDGQREQWRDKRRPLRYAFAWWDSRPLLFCEQQSR